MIWLFLPILVVVALLLGGVASFVIAMRRSLGEVAGNRY
jgi:hypothetical protein